MSPLLPVEDGLGSCRARLPGVGAHARGRRPPAFASRCQPRCRKTSPAAQPSPESQRICRPEYDAEFDATPSIVAPLRLRKVPMKGGHLREGCCQGGWGSGLWASFRFPAVSVILLKVHSVCIFVNPLERNAPRSVDRESIALRLASEWVKFKSGHIEFRGIGRCIQRVESAKGSRLKIWSHASAPTGLIKLPKSLVAEALDHFRV